MSWRTALGRDVSDGVCSTEGDPYGRVEVGGGGRGASRKSPAISYLYGIRANSHDLITEYGYVVAYFALVAVSPLEAACLGMRVLRTLTAYL